MLRRRRQDQAAEPVRPPEPHPSGERPPAIPAEFVPNHVALVMDGNGRWANLRGLPRTEGHKRGEAVLIDVAQGAIELGVKWLSVYAFSTENWKRSPEEVRFLMGFNRDVIRRQVDFLGSIGVRVRWAGRKPKLWRSVIKELQAAEEKTRHNDVLNLTMCVNYGGRAEIVDSVREIARLAADGKINPERIDERMLSRHGYVPEMPPVDMFLRPSGELRTSNFLVWQAAYAEMVYQNTLFPDFDRRDFWRACEEYARRDRRFGAAVDQHSGAAVDQNGGAAVGRRSAAGGHQGARADHRPGAGLHIGSDVEVDDFGGDFSGDFGDDPSLDQPYPDEPHPVEADLAEPVPTAPNGSAHSTTSPAADHGDVRPSGGMA